MSVRMLVDTNVWVDFFDQTRPGGAAADALVRRAIERGDTLLYSVNTVQNLYYALWATAKRFLREAYGELSEAAVNAAEGCAWDCVRSLGEIATCVGADQSDLLIAEKGHGIHRDLEDNLVVAAAQRCGADVLVTSDHVLLSHAPVVALTPSDALTYFERRGDV